MILWQFLYKPIVVFQHHHRKTTVNKNGDNCAYPRSIFKALKNND